MEFNRLPNQRFTVRKEGGLLSSLVGVLVGLGLIVIASPLAVWYAESQHAADDFGSAQQVSADTTVDGYIAVEGPALPTETLACPNSTALEAESCAYVTAKVEEYKRTEKDQCGTVPTNAEIVQQLDPECDRDGTNCSKCYRIAEYAWSQVSSMEDYADFTVGSYTIIPDAAQWIGEQSLTQYTVVERQSKPEVGDQRTSYQYLPANQRLLVAGTAVNGRISSAADGKPYLISNLDYAGTLANMEQQDATMKWGLRIVSLVLMVIGMVLLASPLTYFTNIFRFIPFLGKHLDQGFDAVIGFVAALLGIIAWIILWVTVLLIKNILVILALLVVIGIVIVVVVQRGKRKAKTPNASA